MKTVPDLRFPEFTDDWQALRYDEVFNISAGGDIAKTDVKKNRDETYKYPVFSNSDTDSGLYGYAKTFKQAAGAVTVTGRGSLGIAVARYENFYPIVRLLVLRPKHEGDIKFYENLINFKDFFIESTGVPQLTAPQIANYTLIIPEADEQKKIGLFLASIDTRTYLLTQRIDALKKYRETISQKIFTQKVRFKDEKGNYFADWEQAKLGNLATIVKGTQLNGDDLIEGGEYPMLNGGINPSGFTDQYNSEGEVVTISEGGNSCGYVNFMREKFWSGGHLYTLQNLHVNKFYLYHYLKYSQQRIMRLRVGSGLPNIQKNDLAKFLVALPEEPEQQKIAEVLTAINDKINSDEMKLDQLKSFKKSLLQRMLV